MALKVNLKKSSPKDWNEVTASQFAKLHGLNISCVRKLCREGRIEGVRKIVNKYYMPPKARIKWTNKEKIKRMARALRCYGNMDLWQHGNGCPFIDGKPYGHEQKGDGVFYNLFQLYPAQDGWKLAYDTLTELCEIL